MRAAFFTGLGDPSVLRIIEVPARAPGLHEVQLRVTSAGLNRADANYRRGRYLVKSPGASRSGFEGAGVVTALGTGVTRWHVGDRVAVLPSSFDVVAEGACADAMTVAEDALVATPANVDDRDAGSIWMQCLTAWGPLVEIAAIGPGDWVVVPAASSSVGIASIQLCRARGARVIATTTSATKVEALRRFVPDAIVDTGTEPYVERVTEIAGGRGGRVVFDPIDGPIVNDHIKVASEEAIVFVYGALDPRPFELGLGGMLRKNIRLQGYTLGPLLRDPSRRARALAEVTALLERGDFTPVVDAYFPLDRIQDTHRRLESNLLPRSARGRPGRCYAGNANARSSPTAGGGRAGAGSGVSVGRPRCRRMRWTAGGSSVVATKRSRAPQSHARTSISKEIVAAFRGRGGPRRARCGHRGDRTPRRGRARGTRPWRAGRSSCVRPARHAPRAPCRGGSVR